MAYRQSKYANRTIVYSIMCTVSCVRISVIYTVLDYCFGDFLGYIYNSEVPDNRHYRTTHSTC
jgi:hypothetical protein